MRPICSYPSPSSPRHPAMTAVLSSPPPELWMYIQKLATEDIVPCDCANPNDALSEFDMKRCLQIALSFRKVCKSWNDMAHEILYENVWVNEGFDSLTAALKDPETACRVRRIRFSGARYDQNAAILCQCPRVEVLVQPECPRACQYPDRNTRLPSLPTLRELFWIQSHRSSEFLMNVLHAAPNLTHVCLSTSWTIGTDPNWAPIIPALPHLASLELARLSPPWVRAFLSIDLGSLMHLSIDPIHFRWAEFPELPALRTLSLVAPTGLPFSEIFERCPNVRELRYDVRSSIERPIEAVAHHLACVRLRLPVAQSNADLVEDHFRLLLEPAFPTLTHVILEGLWGNGLQVRMQMGEDYGRLCDELRGRGGRLEFDAH